MKFIFEWYWIICNVCRIMFSLLNFITLSTWKKGEKNDIRHIKDDNNMYQQCLYIYDILYLNGRVLTNLPMNQRVAMIREIVPKDFEGKITIKIMTLDFSAEIQMILILILWYSLYHVLCCILRWQEAWSKSSPIVTVCIFILWYSLYHVLCCILWSCDFCDFHNSLGLMQLFASYHRMFCKVCRQTLPQLNQQEWNRLVTTH